jgi:hypothetical protein
LRRKSPAFFFFDVVVVVGVDGYLDVVIGCFVVGAEVVVGGRVGGAQGSVACVVEFGGDAGQAWIVRAASIGGRT